MHETLPMSCVQTSTAAAQRKRGEMITKTSSSRCDVLIVGGRCAGAATAMLLARRGLRVRVVEKRAYGADALSTHALMRGAVMQLRHWGLLDRLRAAGTPPVKSAVFVYGQERIAVDVRPTDGVDALFAPRRTVLDALLADAARDAGARIDFGTAWVRALRDGQGRMRGAVLEAPDGSRDTVQADIVIGADGIGSGIAQAAGAGIVREGRHASAILFAYWNGMEDDTYEWGYHDKISTGVIPTNDGKACVFVAIPAGYFKPLGGEALRRHYCNLIARRAPALHERLRGATLAGTVRAFGGRAGFLRKAVGNGWALVGDASYFKDPLTAHGITDALRDAEGLAEAVACGTGAALARYEDERNAMSLALFDATDAIASFDWTAERLKTLHQSVNAAMKAEVDMLRLRHRKQE